jgi:Family of unknown function (DUF5685)
MFGFLNPRPHSADYRRAYARLCQHQRRQYSLFSLPFHSYEAVFLYQFALDAGAFNACAMPNVRCCRLASPASLVNAPDVAYGRFSSSVAVLLASIKLQDDILDHKGLLARVVRWVLRRQIAKAEAYFATLDPRFAANVRALIADHHVLERRGGTIPLDEYVVPTANAFGYVFGLQANLPGLADHRDRLIRIGRSVGASLIAFDCAVDWKRDRRRGEFNPLPDEASAIAALERSADWLHEAEVETVAAFGTDARTTQTLRTVRDRIDTIDPFADRKTCVTPRQILVHQAKRIALPVFASAASNNNGGNPPPFPEDDDGTENTNRRNRNSSGTTGSNRRGRVNDGVQSNRKTTNNNGCGNGFCEAYCCAEGCCATLECIACAAN